MKKTKNNHRWVFILNTRNQILKKRNNELNSSNKLIFIKSKIKTKTRMEVNYI